MNSILHLKGQLESAPNSAIGGMPNIPKNKVVASSHLYELKDQLIAIYNRWLRDTTIAGALVSAHYNKIVAKSNRISALLNGNQTIVGARFNKEKNKHIFTHFVSLQDLWETICDVEKSAKYIDAEYSGIISNYDIEQIQKNKVKINVGLSRTKFIRIIIDCYYIDFFNIDVLDIKSNDAQIVTLYKTGKNINELLSSFGIYALDSKMLDENTIMLNKNEFEILYNKAPYLISMKTNDLSQLDINDVINYDQVGVISIPSPKDEPIIGVIDTMFDENVYFSSWVEFKNMLDPNIDLVSKDYDHGTEVSSIIVDGPQFNRNLDDGCGRFRVKHFGVATSGKFSSFTVLKLIQQIVIENPSIKVWNLSLGSVLPISDNFISPEAAVLDKIQYENDCIFVIAGTNKNREQDSDIIGAPADSLNSVVVNSVKFNGESASYTRNGPVLSFFQKPDISYYGGDDREPLVVCSPLGKKYVCGTSFAAPWISRKLAYMICKLGLSRHIAKALLIDSAAGWKNIRNYSIGYGVVPIKVNDIIKSPDDEIKFFIQGIAKEYMTYSYNIPVPQDSNSHPYFAKATLCYFPLCSRNQGVDYTNTEVDIHFGRVVGQNQGKIKIKSIDNNVQDDNGSFVYEQEAREIFRKWDNIKHISECVKESARPRKVYGTGMWGLMIKTKERTKGTNKKMQFGIVVTLKEMNGINRIQSFIDNCRLKGWIVNKIDVENQIDIYNHLEEDINLD